MAPAILLNWNPFQLTLFYGSALQNKEINIACLIWIKRTTCCGCKHCPWLHNNVLSYFLLFYGIRLLVAPKTVKEFCSKSIRALFAFCLPVLKQRKKQPQNLNSKSHTSPSAMKKSPLIIWSQMFVINPITRHWVLVKYTLLSHWKKSSFHTLWCTSHVDHVTHTQTHIYTKQTQLPHIQTDKKTQIEGAGAK